MKCFLPLTYGKNEKIGSMGGDATALSVPLLKMEKHAHYGPVQVAGTRNVRVHKTQVTLFIASFSLLLFDIFQPSTL